MRLIDACALQEEYKARHSGKRLLLIDVAPTVDVVPAKRGKWIEANTHIYGIYECTACKAWTYIPHEPRDYSFCPKCGADMRGERHEVI